MLEFWNKVVYELNCYQRVFVAIVVAHKKGSPGTVRAQLLCTESGEVIGTIGGGIMESRLVEEAKATLESGPFHPQLKTLVHHKSEEAFESGLVCGGSQTLATLVLEPDDRKVLYEVVNRLRYGETGRLIVDPSGIRLEEEDLDDAPCALKSEGDDWEASIGLFNRRRILIVGCGHCGAALARQMNLLGFHVTVVESRAGLPTIQNLPKTIQFLARSYSEAATGVEHARLTFAVVVTPSYPDDVDALTGLLPAAFPFIGVMGSPSKLQKIKDELYTRGFSESDWARVTAPVGVPVNSDTPEEIAVSIAAQILQLSNQNTDT